MCTSRGQGGLDALRRDAANGHCSSAAGAVAAVLSADAIHVKEEILGSDVHFKVEPDVDEGAGSNLPFKQLGSGTITLDRPGGSFFSCAIERDQGIRYESSFCCLTFKSYRFRTGFDQHFGHSRNMQTLNFSNYLHLQHFQFVQQTAFLFVVSEPNCTSCAFLFTSGFSKLVMFLLDDSVEQSPVFSRTLKSLWP